MTLHQPSTYSFCWIREIADTFWSNVLRYFAQCVTHWWVVLVSVENTRRLLIGLPGYSPAPLVPHWCMSHCVPVCGGENVHWQKPCEDRSSQQQLMCNRFWLVCFFLFAVSDMQSHIIWSHGQTCIKHMKPNNEKCNYYHLKQKQQMDQLISWS